MLTPPSTLSHPPHADSQVRTMAKKIEGYCQPHDNQEYADRGNTVFVNQVQRTGKDPRCTVVVHDGPSERVYLESEVKAMKEAGDALDRKFIDLVAFASVHLPSNCLQELVDDWAGHDERAAWKEASKAP